MQVAGVVAWVVDYHCLNKQIQIFEFGHPHPEPRQESGIGRTLHEYRSECCRTTN